MARGGVNQATVQKARLAILARGEHPSIDAVRIELGNTGSKTTIHRYLKELDNRAPAISNAPDIDEELQALVIELATRLREQAKATLDEGEARLEAERARWQRALEHGQLRTDELQRRVEEQQQLIGEQELALDTARAASEASRTEAARLTQAVEEMNTRLADRGTQIASLEDKHQHARNALEHYRQAAQDQRAQEQQRHEHQLQQVQMELRQARQQIAVQFEQLTLLNRDNERLIAQSRAASEEVKAQHILREQAEQATREVSERHQQAITRSALLEQRLQAREQDASAAVSRLNERDQQYRVLELILARTETALENLKRRYETPQAAPPE